MCNRYRMTAEEAALRERYGFTNRQEFPTIPTGDLFPDRPALVITGTGADRRAEAMSWGFPRTVPGKTIDKATGKPKLLHKAVTNVRNVESGFWRSALTTPDRRCLVPFTAFSEYGQQRGADGKLPLHWFAIPSRPIASFAGIWRPTETGPVFAFLTCEPNSLVAPIHPKAMPVILADEDEERWLTAPVEDALALQAPYPAQLMMVD